MFLLPLSSTCMPGGAEERVVRHLIMGLFNSISRQTWCDVITCWASVSDWNVMYQLLLCANSTLITFGQLSFLNSDSTSCKMNTRNRLTCPVNITYNLMFPKTRRSQSSRYQLYLNRCGFRDLPQDDNAPLVIWTHFLPFLVHLYHRRGWGNFKVFKSRPCRKCMQFFLTQPLKTFSLHLNTSRMSSMSVVRTLMPSMLAIVQIGTNWSLSIWDIKYKSFERFSLNHRTNWCRLEPSWIGNTSKLWHKQARNALRQRDSHGSIFSWVFDPQIS